MAPVSVNARRLQRKGGWSLFRDIPDMFDPSFLAMAQRSDGCPSRWRRPLLRWLDGTDVGWTIPVLLAGFVAISTGYLIIAYQEADLHPDVLETWTLGRTFAWGNPKHPPLMGWIAGLWTTVFPLSNWSMQLMAIVNAAAGLWFVDLISRQFTSGDKRVLILLLLTLTPAYQFHAQRFNANSVLLSLWPLATYCFLRSFQTRDARWAVTAGVTAALAMLGKYYSIFLIAAFVGDALVHRSRKDYLLSAAPWIAAASGVTALAPHLLWMAQTGATTIDYARLHVMSDGPTPLHEIFYFLFGLILAGSVSTVTWVLIAGRRLSRIASDFAGMNDGLMLLLLIGAGTIVFPVMTCLILGTDLPSLWALQGLFLFAVPVVASTTYRIERFYTVNALVFCVLVAVVAITVAAPLHAIYRNKYGYQEGRSFYRQAAVELTRQWHEVNDAPLSLVGGDDALAYAAAFYSPDHPYYAKPLFHQHAWPFPRKMMLEHGWAALCFVEQIECLDWMRATAARTPRAKQRQFDVQARLLGTPGIRRTVVSLIVPGTESAPGDFGSTGDAKR